MYAYSILLVLSLSLQALAPYTVWYSRKNIVTHLGAGFIAVAYIIPGLFTDYYLGFSDEVIEIYVWSSFTGAFAYLGGLQVSRLYSPRKRWVLDQINFLRSTRFDKQISSNLKALLLFAIFALTLGYLIMGYVPMFAADPYLAKYFKGEYRDSYLRAAWIFRLGTMVAIFVMPIALVYSIETRKRWFMYASGALCVLVLVSLVKGSALVWLLLCAGVYAAQSKRWFLVYLLALVGVNLAGSAFNYFFFLLTGSQALSDNQGFAQIVAGGAPDLFDQLSVIDAFLRGGSEYTYGRTFFGGLVPFSYQWNPAIWTLDLINDGADLTEISSGGLRLPVSLWGYVSFGWLGVIVIPALSGFLLGCFLRIARVVVRSTDDNVTLIVVTMLLQSVFVPISAFYLITIYMLPAVAISLFLIRRKRFVFKLPSSERTA